jgi:hypothetical protein
MSASLSAAVPEFICLQEVKDTKDKRDALLARIMDITRDLCGTILRMDATNHRDLVTRLMADVETYAKLNLFSFACVKSDSTTGTD